MTWVTAVLAVYGAVLSTWLACVAWNRERQRVYFATGFRKGEGWARLEIVVVNVGHRPVSLQSAHFEQDDGGGYLPTLDDELGLPCKLAEGDTLPLSFHVLDLWPGTSAFVVQAYEREHRHVFGAEMRQNWEDAATDVA